MYFYFVLLYAFIFVQKFMYYFITLIKRKDVVKYNRAIPYKFRHAF